MKAAPGIPQNTKNRWVGYGLGCPMVLAGILCWLASDTPQSAYPLILMGLLNCGLGKIAGQRGEMGTTFPKKSSPLPRADRGDVYYIKMD